MELQQQLDVAPLRQCEGDLRRKIVQDVAAAAMRILQPFSELDFGCDINAGGNSLSSGCNRSTGIATSADRAPPKPRLHASIESVGRRPIRSSRATCPMAAIGRLTAAPIMWPSPHCHAVGKRGCRTRILLISLVTSLPPNTATPQSPAHGSTRCCSCHWIRRSSSAVWQRAGTGCQMSVVR